MCTNNVPVDIQVFHGEQLQISLVPNLPELCSKVAKDLPWHLLILEEFEVANESGYLSFNSSRKMARQKLSSLKSSVSVMPSSRTLAPRCV